MRVGIDVTPLLRAPTGIAVCTRLLVEGVRGAGHEVIGLVSGWRRMKTDARELPVPARSSWLPRILNPLFLDTLQWPSLETVLGEVDVFIATNYAIRPSRRARTVALIHDVGRLLHPSLYGRRQVWRARFMVRRCARFADILVVPTESVGREVVELGIATPDRIRVVLWSWFG